jgi:putative ABC transport system permease protein
VSFALAGFRGYDLPAVRFFVQHVVRYALRHKVLGVINILSVALGVSTFLAVQIANRSATAAFRAGIDVVAGRANIETRGTLDDRLFPQLQKIPGVIAATPLVEQIVTLPGWPGEYLHVVGVDPLTNSTFENFKVSKSDGVSFDADAWFGNPRSLTVAKNFADSHQLKRGDVIRVKFGEREVELVLSSVLEAKDGDARFAAMDIGWAQELFGLQGKLTGVLFRISDPNNPEPVRQRIRNLVPPDAVVQEPGARSGQVEQLLSGFALNLTALSMISLLVGVFLIYNTVTASVVRRRGEVGILRALGASRAKVRWLFLGEAALYGLIGSVLGCVGGVLLSNFLVAAVSKTVTNLYVLTSIDHFYLPVWQIPLVLVVGMGSVLVGAFIPANSGANLPPLRALNMGVLIERSERPRLSWIILSGACLLAAFGASEVALGGYRIAGFAAAFFTLIGFCCFAPYLTNQFGTWAGRILRSLLLPRLAARNLVRSVYRHAITVAALGSALAMLVSVSIMIYSFRRTIDRWLEHRLVADLFIAPAANEIVGFENFTADELIRFLQARPEVETIDTFRYLTATVNGVPASLAVVTGTDRNIPDFIGGKNKEKYEAFRAPDRVTISEPLSHRLKVNQGDKVTVATPLGPHEFEVAGVFYDYSRDSGLMLMQRANFEKIWHDPRINSVAEQTSKK